MRKHNTSHANLSKYHADELTKDTDTIRGDLSKDTDTIRGDLSKDTDTIRGDLSKDTDDSGPIKANGAIKT